MRSANQSKTILIIEEDNSQRAHFNEYVDKRFGVSLIIKENCQTALAYLQNVQQTHAALPSLLLVNYQDILMTGQMLFDELKKINLRGCLPVIALNDTDDKAIIDEAYNRGVASYFIKPTERQAWHSFFTLLIRYWFEEVTLPSYSISC
jgi:PleD family two-component response regulator